MYRHSPVLVHRFWHPFKDDGAREEMFVKAELDDKLGGQATSPDLQCYETMEAGGGEESVTEGVYLSDRQIAGMRNAVLRTGATIEVFAEGDWWLADVVAINKNLVRVHYEGGEDDEDEWLEQNSDRIKEAHILKSSL
jgi:hypothetical protein